MSARPGQVVLAPVSGGQLRQPITVEVVGLHPEKNIILVKGGVAGSNDGLIVIKPSVKIALRAAHKAKNTRK